MNTKKNRILFFILMSTTLCKAQVGIGNIDPKASLDISATSQATPSNTDGVLIPRIDNFPLINPTANQDGMLLYATGIGSPSKGFYFWNNNIVDWVSIVGGEKINDLLDGKSDDSGTNDGSSVFLGINAGAADNGTDNKNVGIGFEALKASTSGVENTAVGYFTLLENTTGSYNVGIGFLSLYHNTTGSYNVALGQQANRNNTEGDGNTSVGFRTLRNNITQDYNTALGYNAAQIGSVTNTTSIGYGASATASNEVRLGNSAITSIGGYANWTNVSDKRFKINIRENVIGIDFIKKLRPVTYTLDMEAIANFNKTPDSLRLKDAELLKGNELQSGFIAQEVAIAAKSVGYNFHGVDIPKSNKAFYGLRYAEFVVPLVKAVQEQQEQIEKLVLTDKILINDISEYNKKIQELNKRLKKIEKKLGKDI